MFLGQRPRQRQGTGAPGDWGVAQDHVEILSLSRDKGQVQSVSHHPTFSGKLGSIQGSAAFSVKSKSHVNVSNNPWPAPGAQAPVCPGNLEKTRNKKTMQLSKWQGSYLTVLSIGEALS